METISFETVFSKKYIELSALEREDMKDLFTNEDEFNQMKFTLSSIQNTILEKTKNDIPSVNTKERLDHLYHKTYQNKGILWYNSIGTFFIASDKNWYNQNLVRIAAVFVVLFSIYPFLNKSLLEDKIQMSQVEKITRKETKKAEKNSPELVDTEVVMDLSNNMVYSPNSVDKSSVSNEKDFVNGSKIVKSNNVVRELKDEMFSSVAVTASDISISNHPDGVFTGSSSKASNDIVSSSTVFSVKSNPDLLDLLTPTF